jgi:hypothetical protein
MTWGSLGTRVLTHPHWILLAYLQNIGSSRPDSGVSHRWGEGQLKGLCVFSLEEEYESPKTIYVFVVYGKEFRLLDTTFVYLC